MIPLWYKVFLSAFLHDSPTLYRLKLNITLSRDPKEFCYILVQIYGNCATLVFRLDSLNIFLKRGALLQTQEEDCFLEWRWLSLIR